MGSDDLDDEIRGLLDSCEGLPAEERDAVLSQFIESRSQRGGIPPVVFGGDVVEDFLSRRVPKLHNLPYLFDGPVAGDRVQPPLGQSQAPAQGQPQVRAPVRQKRQRPEPVVHKKTLRKAIKKECARRGEIPDRGR